MVQTERKKAYDRERMQKKREYDRVRIERMTFVLGEIIRHGEMANIDKGGPHWGSGKKPPTIDAWAFPRHMLTDIEEALKIED